MLAERQRCCQLVEALLHNVNVPTAMSFVITAEKILAGYPVEGSAKVERQRCAAIVDAAALRPFESRPAEWALSLINAGEAAPAEETGPVRKD